MSRIRHSKLVIFLVLILIMGLLPVKITNAQSAKPVTIKMHTMQDSGTIMEVQNTGDEISTMGAEPYDQVCRALK